MQSISQNLGESSKDSPSPRNRLQSISKELVEEWKTTKFDDRNLIGTRIEQHAETCEAILKEMNEHRKEPIFASSSSPNYIHKLHDWLENEIKILKDAKLI